METFADLLFVFSWFLCHSKQDYRLNIFFSNVMSKEENENYFEYDFKRNLMMFVVVSICFQIYKIL